MKENNPQGHLKSNSIVMCQIIFTSDQGFFDKIGEKETKRYFDECYKFICNYKDLGEKNIIAAVVHLDEGAPHMQRSPAPVMGSGSLCRAMQPLSCNTAVGGY